MPKLRHERRQPSAAKPKSIMHGKAPFLSGIFISFFSISAKFDGCQAQTSSCMIVTSMFHVLILMLSPIALRKAKIVYNFGLSECNRV